MNKLILKLVFISVVVFLSSCAGDSGAGYEFMPNIKAILSSSGAKQ